MQVRFNNIVDIVIGICTFIIKFILLIISLSYSLNLIAICKMFCLDTLFLRKLQHNQEKLYSTILIDINSIYHSSLSLPQPKYVIFILNIIKRDMSQKIFLCMVKNQQYKVKKHSLSNEMHCTFYLSDIITQEFSKFVS